MSEPSFVRLSERKDYLTVDTRGLTEVDPVRAAEDELISAYVAYHRCDYTEAFRRLVADGKLR